MIEVVQSLTREKMVKDTKAVQQIQERAKRLKYIRKMLLSLTVEQLAKETGINLHTLKTWDIGRHSGLSAKGARALCEFLESRNIHCTEEWLMTGIGLPPQNLKDTNQANVSDQLMQEEVGLYCRLYQGIAIKLHDEAMEPAFHSGDYVAGVNLRDHQDAAGKSCIVTLAGGNKIFRHVVSVETNKKSTQATLRATNLNYLREDHLLESVEVEAFAPVTRHYHNP